MKIFKQRRRNPTGNGHKGNGEVLGDSQGFNVGDYFEGMFPSVGHSSPAKDFMEPGKDFASSLFRSVIPDARLGNAILRLHMRHKKFADKDHDEMLENKLHELVARYGRARLEGLFGTTNMLSPDMYKEVAGGMLGKPKKGDNKVVFSNPKLPRQDVTEEDDT